MDGVHSEEIQRLIERERGKVRSINDGSVGEKPVYSGNFAVVNGGVMSYRDAQEFDFDGYRSMN
jgi:hypothetical protein